MWFTDAWRLHAQLSSEMLTPEYTDMITYALVELDLWAFFCRIKFGDGLGFLHGRAHMGLLSPSNRLTPMMFSPI
jgi:hypothetical protein